MLERSNTGLFAQTLILKQQISSRETRVTTLPDFLKTVLPVNEEKGEPTKKHEEFLEGIRVRETSTKLETFTTFCYLFSS